MTSIVCFFVTVVSEDASESAVIEISYSLLSQSVRCAVFSYSRLSPSVLSGSKNAASSISGISSSCNSLFCSASFVFPDSCVSSGVSVVSVSSVSSGVSVVSVFPVSSGISVPSAFSVFSGVSVHSVSSVFSGVSVISISSVFSFILSVSSCVIDSNPVVSGSIAPVIVTPDIRRAALRTNAAILFLFILCLIFSCSLSVIVLKSSPYFTSFKSAHIEMF